MRPWGGEQDPSFDQLLIEFAHRLKRLKYLGRGEKALFAVLGSLHEHHYTHRPSPCFSRPYRLSVGTTNGVFRGRHRPADFFNRLRCWARNGGFPGQGSRYRDEHERLRKRLWRICLCPLEPAAPPSMAWTGHIPNARWRAAKSYAPVLDLAMKWVLDFNRDCQRCCPNASQACPVRP